jgi:hypothetical protein
MTRARDLASNAQGSKPTIVDAKGDIVVATAADTVDRLAVGDNGSIIVADSAESVGLRWSGNYAAGKNKIINGAFNIWQRGTSFTNPAAAAYLADRYSIDYNTGTANCVVSQQAFTAGTAPVAGYESSYFMRISQSAGTASRTIYIGQKIEDVRTFAGQTITFSFWAKANASKTLTTRAVQVFGSGGSGAVATSGSANSITTSWARYSNTISIPSIAGKTIGTGSYITFDFSYDADAIQDIDTWGWQVEAGSVATAFQTATGTLQGELAACQRYFYNHVTGHFFTVAMGYYANATNVQFYTKFPVTMRTTPSLSMASGTDYYQASNGSDNFNSGTISQAHTNGALIFNNSEVSGTSGQGTMIETRNASASISFSAEL